jgi:nucleotide-binding universal stress UspA family protein
LIVMTTRGQGGLTRWLVGSVAEKVMRLARCPVLLVKSDPAALSRSRSWQPRRVLVPLDGSTFADQALPPAYRWAAALGAEVMLASVQPWMATRIAAFDGYMPDVATLDEQVAEAATEHLAGAQAQAPAALSVATTLLRGEPAGCLVDLIEQQRIDLVVMTSHGRGGIGRLVLGSVADRLVQSGAAPVVIFHPVDSAPASEEPAVTAASRSDAT